MVAIELLRARPHNRDRAARRPPRPGSTANDSADDVRTHVVQAVGLGIEGDERRRSQLREPGVEFLLRDDLLIVARLRPGCARRRRGRGRRRPRLGARRSPRRCRRLPARRRCRPERLEQRAQFQARVQLSQARRRPARRRSEPSGRHLERHDRYRWSRACATTRASAARCADSRRPCR